MNDILFNVLNVIYSQKSLEDKGENLVPVSIRSQVKDLYNNYENNSSFISLLKEFINEYINKKYIQSRDIDREYLEYTFDCSPDGIHELLKLISYANNTALDKYYYICKDKNNNKVRIELSSEDIINLYNNIKNSQDLTWEIYNNLITELNSLQKFSEIEIFSNKIGINLQNINEIL